MFPMQGNQSDEKLYVDDVFSAYPRTGTGADVTVTTGIDMTKGYMLWSKGRSGATDHAIYDSARGVTLDLASNTTAAQTTQSTGLKAVSSTGHTVGSLAKMNTSGATYVDFVFRKAPKFFDVVTYTGNGVAGRQIPHALGIAPGMIVVKRTTSASDWVVYHRGLTSAAYGASLNSTSAQVSAPTYWNSTNPDSTSFTVGSNLDTNGNGVIYVAYLFAHDPSPDGIIQCGSFTTDGSGNATVNLGWEPQFTIIKASSGGGSWVMRDTMRGLGANTGTASSKNLYAESSSAEVDGGTIGITATGITVAGGSTSLTYIYLAIRRPNKPPTRGTEVYNAIARTGTGAAATVTGVGFAPDVVLSKDRGVSTVSWWSWYDKLRGKNLTVHSNTVDVESSDISGLNSFDMNGVSLGTDTSWQRINASSAPYINHFFRRAVGCFDQVCYVGDDTGFATILHGMGTSPELIIVKNRTTAGNWTCGSAYLPNGFGTEANTSHELILNSTAASVQQAYLKAVNATSFKVSYSYNRVGSSYTAYLFASLPGISKVGSYTGNGSSQTINCGFTTGARFFLVKATSTTGSWWVFDSVRGVVSSTDPALQLNSTAAEITSADAVDPDASGIIVNQEATCSINANGVSYVFLAIA